MKTISIADLPAQIGQEIGVSEWLVLPQDKINQFADVTDDHQFIHVDEEAAKMTPFGGTIAHGFLTLSMLSRMAEDAAFQLEGAVAALNYGFDRVRFISPVRSGSRIRAHFTLESASERKPGQWMITFAVSVEIEGLEKPALTAQWLFIQMLG